MEKSNRIFSLDLLRVVTCLLVVWQHTSEFYYIPSSFRVEANDNTFWVGIMTSIARTSVPLFVMITGYFLLPVSGAVSAFFRKRFTRILYPFIAWCVIYAAYYVFYRGDSLQQMWTNILHIPVNFGTQVGHLWYIYMLIGLYLLLPILSPWLQKASKRELQGYLCLWGVTALLPYLHLIFPEIWGECFWNPSPMLYYFTGFAGYLVAGYYLKTYGPLRPSVATLLLLGGYAVTAIVFCSRIHEAEWINELELSWGFCTLNVAAAATGIFSLFQSLSCKEGEHHPVGRLIGHMSQLSYGIYLAHIIVLNAYHDLFAHISSAPVAIPLIAFCTLATTYVAVWLLSLLPGRNYWLG